MFDSFPVCRSILDHWIYDDAEYLKLWITILSRARYLETKKTGIYQGVKYELNYGEFIFGRLKFAKDTGINESKIKRFIAKLIKDEMITLINRTNKFTIYLVTNYSKYNGKGKQESDQQETVENKEIEQDGDQQNDQQVTSKRPADDQQVTTNKESNNSNKDNKDISINEVWKYYSEKLKVLGKTRRKTDNKTKHIHARLEEFTVDQLKQVMDNVFSSEWMLGENPKKKMYIEIDNFMCNTEKIEKWLDIKPKGIEQKPYWSNIDS